MSHLGMAGKLLWTTITISSAALLGFGSGAAAGRTAPISRMNATEAKLAAEQGTVLLVDVRQPGQRALGHIRGDLHMPVEQVAAHAAELPRDRRIVFYCSCPAEELAIEAAQGFLQSGSADVAVLVGGFDAWRDAGGEIEVPSTWNETFHVALPPTGWGKTPVDSSRCRYLADRRFAVEGTRSGCVACRADIAGHGLAGFSQRIDALPFFKRTVTLSAMIRSEDVAEAGYLWVGVENPEGRLIAWMRSVDNPILATQDWHPVEVSGTVPSGVGKIVIGLSLEGSGRIWIDDVRLVAPGERGLPSLPAAITNPGFEE